MRYRVDLGRNGARPRRGGWRRWSAAVAVLALGALACVPRLSPAPAEGEPPAARGFLPEAVAAPAAPALQAPPAPSLDSLREVERELRASLEEAERRDEAAAFPIAAEHEMSSTAYCLKGRTRTGIRTRDGVAAADPSFLPLGSVVRLSLPDGSPLGVFVIMDTGGAVKGKKIDIYMESCAEARRWGRKKVLAEVLDLGRDTR